MQKFYHSVKIFALSLILAISANGAPEIKFKVAYPKLKIKKPVWVTLLPGTDQELIVSQSGTIHELPKDRSAGNAKLWFDLTSRVQIDKDFEEGLLGLVFNPDHKSNGKFYVYYSRQNPKRSVLSEFVTKNGKPDPNSERILLEINHTYSLIH